jgi:type II secretory pathway pseudopilin PulG
VSGVHAQRGFAILELTVALLIATLLAVWGASQLVNRANDAAAQAAAVWMASVRMAAFSYIDRHRSALQEASGAMDMGHLGYADWARPSVAELKAAGLLSSGFPEHGLRGLEVTVQVLRSGVCPGSDCRVEALVHSNAALSFNTSTVADEQMVAQWLMAAQGYGGTVTRARPHRVAGTAFEFPNPPASGLDALPAGTVAMAVTTEQLAVVDYLRVRDRRDPQFQSELTVAGDVRAQASVSVQGFLSLGAEAQERSGCEQDAQVARSNAGGLLVCRNKIWLSAGGRGGGGYSTNSKTGCVAGTYNLVTGACSCPEGYGAIRIAESGSIMAAEGLTRGYLCVS